MIRTEVKELTSLTIKRIIVWKKPFFPNLVNKLVSFVDGCEPQRCYTANMIGVNLKVTHQEYWMYSVSRIFADKISLDYSECDINFLVNTIEETRAAPKSEKENLAKSDLSSKVHNLYLALNEIEKENNIAM